MDELAFLTGKKSRNQGIQALFCLLLSWHGSQISTQRVQPCTYNWHIAFQGPSPSLQVYQRAFRTKLEVVPRTLGTNTLIYRHAKTPQLPTENQSVLTSDFKSIRLSNRISKHLERRDFRSSEKLSSIYLVPNTTTPAPDRPSQPSSQSLPDTDHTRQLLCVTHTRQLHLKPEPQMMQGQEAPLPSRLHSQAWQRPSL